MTKIFLQSIELSDIKNIVEEVLDKKLDKLQVAEEEKPSFLSRKETSKLLRISLPTLHDWTKRGLIKAYRIGNRVLYKLEEVNNSLLQIQTKKMKGGCNG